MDSVLPGLQKTRIGFHYFPDALHYRDVDLNTWLPELQALATSWLTLQAPLNRAIPEPFIRRLCEHEIQPVIHFPYPTNQPPSLEDFNLLCHSYARWGARYVVLFDRPNQRINWSAAAWAQSNLVERFLDIFQPLALMAARAGLTPVFPPLEPGGDYWDTAFLRAAFEGLQRRNQTQLLERMAISCYARSNNHPLNWGSGGPERWPGAHPYQTPRGTEDQRGFRIFDWYLALSEAVFDERRPILCLAGGALPDEKVYDIPSSESPHTTQNLLISRLIMGEQVTLDPIPAELLAFNFWLLTSTREHTSAQAAWYQPDDTILPVVAALQHWGAEHHWTARPTTQAAPSNSEKTVTHRPIAHYLLIASSGAAISDWQMKVIRYFADKYHPTIGFSPAESVLASRVTVLGDQEKLPDSILDGLRAAGCVVDDLRGDGTTIATRLQEY